MTSPRRPPDLVETGAVSSADPFVDALDRIKGKPAGRRDAWRAFFEHFLPQALGGGRRGARTQDTRSQDTGTQDTGTLAGKALDEA